jgi:hypothetical protein
VPEPPEQKARREIDATSPPQEGMATDTADDLEAALEQFTKIAARVRDTASQQSRDQASKSVTRKAAASFSSRRSPRLRGSPSRTTRELKRGLLMSLLREAGLTREELMSLLE